MCLPFSIGKLHKDKTWKVHDRKHFLTGGRTAIESTFHLSDTSAAVKDQVNCMHVELTSSCSSEYVKKAPNGMGEASGKTRPDSLKLLKSAAIVGTAF